MFAKRALLILLPLLISTVDAAAADRRSVDAPAKQQLTVDGSERRYVVDGAPRVLQGRRKVPLVLVLHGGGGNAAITMRMTGFSELAKREGFIVAYPEGTGPTRNMLLTWNSTHCCGTGMRKDMDEARFIRMLIDKLAADYPVDTGRVFVTGMSNGGMMSHQLAIALADRIAGLAPVVGALFGDEALPALPVPAIIFNGMLDRSVKYEGGLTDGRGRRAWDGTPTLPALAQNAFWARANGCSGPAEVLEDNATMTLLKHHCPNGNDVVHYVLKKSGHAWPGGKRGSRAGDEPDSAVDATTLIWQFFKGLPAKHRA
ncbi:MAG: polyhydroxybutyrate depolymerase [Gammaproteobacteria bacterium]|nr:polyhydroxybutyrate depolymerase [Gammaproteobacteria bacterium]